MIPPTPTPSAPARGVCTPSAFPTANLFSMAVLCGRGGRVTALSGGFRPGQSDEEGQEGAAEAQEKGSSHATSRPPGAAEAGGAGAAPWREHHRYGTLRPPTPFDYEIPAGAIYEGETPLSSRGRAQDYSHSLPLRSEGTL